MDKKQFVEWVRNIYPPLYFAAVQRVRSQQAGLGETASTTNYSEIFSGISNILMTYQENRLNRERIKSDARLAAIELERQKIAQQTPIFSTPQGGASMFSNPLVLGALGLVGYMVLSKDEKGRR